MKKLDILIGVTTQIVTKSQIITKIKLVQNQIVTTKIVTKKQTVKT